MTFSHTYMAVRCYKVWEYMPIGKYSTRDIYLVGHSTRIFYNAPVRCIGLLEVFSFAWNLNASHEVLHEYVRMILHPVSVSLAASSYLISNVWQDNDVECR